MLVCGCVSVLCGFYQPFQNLLKLYLKNKAGLRTLKEVDEGRYMFVTQMLMCCRYFLHSCQNQYRQLAPLHLKDGKYFVWDTAVVLPSSGQAILATGKYL